jgi:tyrosine-protein kinase Etk/Wzc
VNEVKEEQMTENPKPGFMGSLNILVKWRRFFFVNFLVVALLAIAVVFVLPKWYRATASVLPPKDQGLLNLFGSASSVLKGLTAIPRIGGFTPPSGAYNYFAILKSRSALEQVARKFDLIHVYDIGDSSMEKTIKALKENTDFEFQDDDYITIDVYDKDPTRAADMANYFVEILNSMSITLGSQEAKGNREFIGQRLDETRANLRGAEEALKLYQEKTGMMMTPEQTSSVSAVAELYALKAKKEIELAVLERKVSADNDLLQQLKLELHELDKKLLTFPQAGLESFRLYREAVTQQKILEVLIPLYEQAKINEQKDIPVLLVLDKAVPPQMKVRPQRALIVLVTMSLYVCFSIIAIFLLHGFLRRGRASNTVEKWAQHRARRLASFYRVDVDS